MAIIMPECSAGSRTICWNNGGGGCRPSRPCDCERTGGGKSPNIMGPADVAKNRKGTLEYYHLLMSNDALNILGGVDRALTRRFAEEYADILTRLVGGAIR